MKLTKFTHSCVRLADGDHQLVVDPGAFSEVEEALDGIDAVLITHEHFDHVDADKLVAAANANAALHIWAPKSVVDDLSGHAELADRLTAVGPGDNFTAGGLSVRTYGGQHAVIHTDLPAISNVGFLINDGVFHPGDAYSVPPVSVEALLVPISAPWAKLSETIDFVTSVRAPKAFQIHDVLLSGPGLSVFESILGGTIEPHGHTALRHLDVRETVEL